MSNSYVSEQEKFWAGNFGDEYIKRNQGDKLWAANLAFFSRALKGAYDIKNCIEFGANIGMNIKALNVLFPGLDSHAIEINSAATRNLGEIIPPDHIYNGSILNYESDKKFDLTLIKGVLIHIDPDLLPQVYSKLYASCGRYLLVAEYYSPDPIAVMYRGEKDRLFKRDFAGEILDLYPQFKLADYGFIYRRDPNFPQDDMTWFLLENQK